MNIESGTRRRWKLIVVLLVLAALYWPAMFVATHLPIRTTPAGDPYSLDKLQHLTAFGTLAVLLSALGAALGFSFWRRSIAIVAFIALYALVDESTQKPPRTPEFFDWLFDVIGACLGVAIYAVFARCWPATCRREPPAG
jgi:VanZ family protein